MSLVEHVPGLQCFIPLFSLFGRYPGLGSLAWLAELEFPDFRCPAWDQHSHLPRPRWLWHWVPLFPGFRWSSLGSSSGKCLRWFPCLCVLNRCPLASVAFLGISVCAGFHLALLRPGFRWSYWGSALAFAWATGLLGVYSSKGSLGPACVSDR